MYTVWFVKYSRRLKHRSPKYTVTNNTTITSFYQYKLPIHYRPQIFIIIIIIHPLTGPIGPDSALIRKLLDLPDVCPLGYSLNHLKVLTDYSSCKHAHAVCSDFPLSCQTNSRFIFCADTSIASCIVTWLPSHKPQKLISAVTLLSTFCLLPMIPKHAKMQKTLT